MPDAAATAPVPCLAAPPLPHWTGAVWRRMRHLFWLKAIGTTAWTWLFFIGYFHLLRHPAQAVVSMPLTALDHWLPFQPGWLGAYLSLWVYVGIAPGLQASLRGLLAYGVWAGALCASGLLAFWLWPNAVPPNAAAATSSAAGMSLIRGIDAAGNACPSMHVAIAMFTVCWIERLLRDVAAPAWLRGLNLAWFAAIVYSTLAVKQHVLLDVLAGGLLGAVFAAASLHWRPRR